MQNYNRICTYLETTRSVCSYIESYVWVWILLWFAKENWMKLSFKTKLFAIESSKRWALKIYSSHLHIYCLFIVYPSTNCQKYGNLNSSKSYLSSFLSSNLLNSVSVDRLLFMYKYSKKRLYPVPKHFLYQ